MKTTAALTTLHELADLPHLPIATNCVDRSYQYYSQASHLVRPHQSSRLYANNRIGRLTNNSRTFTKGLNFLLFMYLQFFVVFFFCIVNFTINIFLSLSYPLYFPSFSCTTIHCFPYQLLFLLLLIHSLPLSSSPPPILPQTITTLSLPPIHPPAD
jgi:hypothetical protein